MKKSLKNAAVAIAALSLILAPAANAAVLKAAGATSVAGLIDKCKADYQSATGHSFDYPGGGSGGARARCGVDRRGSCVLRGGGYIRI